MVVRFRKLRPEAQTPEYKTAGAAGMDLCAAIEQPALIPPGGLTGIGTGLSVEIPAGCEGQVRPRSGLAARNGVTVLNSPGTIDSDYRGEVIVLLINHSSNRYAVLPGDRIAQLVIAPVARPLVVESTDELSGTSRGAGGFGSTGR